MLSKRNAKWEDLQISDYGGIDYIEAFKANEMIKKLISSGTPFYIGRFGETELRTLFCYEHPLLNVLEFKSASYCICNNAGFFPKNIFAIWQFTRYYKSAISKMDYLGMFLWNSEEYYVKKYGKNMKKCFSASILDPLFIASPWTAALKGKKVLVIHPFSQSIQKQYYNNREKLFGTNKDILPEFSLVTIKAVQSIGGEGAEGYHNWFEALEYMKNEISHSEFDIALLGCGAYGNSLGAYIRSLGKQAIYCGGALQLMFGILGLRWEDREYVSRYVNEYWIRPDENEKPVKFVNVESGCYW